jgi:hypothetical protein
MSATLTRLSPNSVLVISYVSMHLQIWAILDFKHPALADRGSQNFPEHGEIVLLLDLDIDIKRANRLVANDDLPRFAIETRLEGRDHRYADVVRPTRFN